MTEKESQMVASAVERCRRYHENTLLPKFPGSPLSENELTILLQADQIARMRAAAKAVIDRYIANAGTPHEFVSCLTEPKSKGTTLLKLWQPLREACNGK